MFINDNVNVFFGQQINEVVKEREADPGFAGQALNQDPNR